MKYKIGQKFICYKRGDLLTYDCRPGEILIITGLSDGPRYPYYASLSNRGHIYDDLKFSDEELNNHFKLLTDIGKLLYQ